MQHRKRILSPQNTSKKARVRAMAPVIAHGVRGLRFSGARYKCGLVVDTNPLRGGTSYFRGVTESEVRRSRKLNSFPLPVALPADVLKMLLSTLPFSSTVCARAPRLARMSNAVDAHSRLSVSVSRENFLRQCCPPPIHDATVASLHL